MPSIENVRIHLVIDIPCHSRFKIGNSKAVAPGCVCIYSNDKRYVCRIDKFLIHQIGRTREVQRIRAGSFGDDDNNVFLLVILIRLLFVCNLVQRFQEWAIVGTRDADVVVFVLLSHCLIFQCDLVAGLFQERRVPVGMRTAVFDFHHEVVIRQVVVRYVDPGLLCLRIVVGEIFRRFLDHVGCEVHNEIAKLKPFLLQLSHVLHFPTILEHIDTGDLSAFHQLPLVYHVGHQSMLIHPAYSHQVRLGNGMQPLPAFGVVGYTIWFPSFVVPFGFLTASADAIAIQPSMGFIIQRLRGVHMVRFQAVCMILVDMIDRIFLPADEFLTI